LLEAEAARLAAAAIDDATVAELQRLHREMVTGLGAGDDERIQDADARFHGLLYGASGNPNLAELIGQLWSSFPRYLLWLVPGRTERSIAEHAAILDAVAGRHPEAAATAVRHHLQQALAALEANFHNLKPPAAHARHAAAGGRR
jgi:DNA-binding GntR family transcriptional regulator